MLTPFNLTFFDGGVLFDRDPSVLRNGITMPVSFFIMLILLLFNNNTYKALFSPLLLVLSAYFFISLVLLPFRISTIIFQVIYMILSIKYFEHYFSNAEKVKVIEKSAFVITFLIISVTLLSALFIKPGYFIIKDIYIYDFQQYFSAMIVLLGTCFMYGRIGYLGFVFGAFLGFVFFEISESRLALMMPIFVALYVFLYKINLTSKVQISLTVVSIFSLYAFYLLNISPDNTPDSDRVYYILKFIKNLDYYFSMFPVFSSKITEVYSYHNEFIEVYKVFGLFFIILYLYLSNFIKKNIYGAASVAIIFFTANVAVMMLHLYTIPILAVLLVLSKRNECTY